jgi:adenylate cyclase
MNYPLSGLHSNVINSIITGSYLKEFPAWASILIDIITILLIFYFSIKYSPLKFTIFSICLFIVFTSALISCYLFGNKLVNIVRPFIGFIFVLISINAYRFIHEEKEKSILRRTFEHYFAPSLLEKIIKMPERLKNSEKKILTVLFSDIAGFTSWCTAHNPEDIRSMLNDYFKEMTHIVFKYDGTIDKYIGDGLMVFFGDPIEHKDHTVRAVKAAFEMQERVVELKDLYKKKYKIDFNIRIGINKGEVVVGNMGSEERIDYTVLGSNVNLAQRLESSASVGGILVSESVFQDVKDLLESYEEKRIKVKGIEKELRVYEVYATSNQSIL